MYVDLSGTCLSPNRIVSWQVATYTIRFILNDMGNIALALLAHDRYEAVVHPVAYKTAEKRPTRRLAAAAVLVIGSTGIQLAGHVSSNNGRFFWWMRLVSWQIGILICDTIRAVYSFVCLYM